MIPMKFESMKEVKIKNLLPTKDPFFCWDHLM